MSDRKNVIMNCINLDHKKNAAIQIPFNLKRTFLTTPIQIQIT